MKRIAVIGCGMRSDAYMHEFKKELAGDWRLEALADPNPAALDVFRRLYGDDAVKTYASGPELIEKSGDSIDGVIIGSPNTFHLESLLPALNKNLIILLEKPVAINVDDCAKMWRAFSKAHNPNVAVGFVLRYTAFYRKVKEILDSGTIGQVLSIDSTESIIPAITALFTREWRRLEKFSGPFIVEKCCHDMDILNMLTGSRPLKVSSFASRTRFVHNPDAAMHCRECSLKDTCRYDVSKIGKKLQYCSPSIEICKVNFSGNDLCVFNSDKDIPDHQVINIQYENGILATFNVSIDQPTPTRTIRILGTLGQIAGDLEEDELNIYLHDEDYLRESLYNKPLKQKIELIHDDSGHHGGDSVITGCFKSMLMNRCFEPLAGLREGIYACLVAFAAEKSRHKGEIVNMEELYSQVF